MVLTPTGKREKVKEILEKINESYVCDVWYY